MNELLKLGITSDCLVGVTQDLSNLGSVVSVNKKLYYSQEGMYYGSMGRTSELRGHTEFYSLELETSNGIVKLNYRVSK